jgi:hypothetical protein
MPAPQPQDVVALISRLLTSNPDAAALPRKHPSSSRAPVPTELHGAATLVVRTSPTAARVEAAGRRPSPLAREPGGGRMAEVSLPYQVADSPTAILNLDVMHRGLEDLTVGRPYRAMPSPSPPLPLRLATLPTPASLGTHHTAPHYPCLLPALPMFAPA